MATRCASRAACNTNHQWTVSVSGATIQSTWPQIGSFTGVSITSADPGHPYDAGYGRVVTIAISGTAQTITIPGTEFYVDLGLNSDLFTVASVSGGTVSLMGQGWGHGIGMGQWGALGYAIGQDHGDGNWTYQQIVAHYYGPAQLTTLADAECPAQRRGRGLLDRRHRRRRVQLRERAIPRQHRRHEAQQAGGRHGGHARRRRLLGGRHRRRRVQLR